MRKNWVFCLLLGIVLSASIISAEAALITPKSTIQAKCDEGDKDAPDHFE
jgi:hypothetical protein